MSQLPPYGPHARSRRGFRIGAGLVLGIVIIGTVIVILDSEITRINEDSDRPCGAGGTLEHCESYDTKAN